MILGIFSDWAQLIEVVGVWLSAIATFAAAYVALRVASKSSNQFVRVSAQPMLEVSRGLSGSTTKIFSISATNKGIRPVTITHLCIRSRIPKYNAILLEGMYGSSSIPVTLSDGETATWRYPEIRPDGKSWYAQFSSHFSDYSKLQKWFVLRSIRFLVITSLGNEFVAPHSIEFRKKLRAQLTEDREKK